MVAFLATLFVAILPFSQPNERLLLAFRSSPLRVPPVSLQLACLQRVVTETSATSDKPRSRLYHDDSTTSATVLSRRCTFVALHDKAIITASVAVVAAGAWSINCRPSLAAGVQERTLGVTADASVPLQISQVRKKIALQPDVARPSEDKTLLPTTTLDSSLSKNATASALLAAPNVTFGDGVLYVELRPGKGEAVVAVGSRVGIELTARCKAFPSARDPTGVKYFSTDLDTEFNEIAFTIGVGQMIPQLEEGMMGMKRGAVRRIEVPSNAVFAAKQLNQLPLPTTKEGKKRYDNLFKSGNNATLVFEVLVTRLK